MANHPTTEGDAQGLSPEPAGSKPIDGDRPCRQCAGTKTVPLEQEFGQIFHTCPRCGGTGVEPSVAPRPGSSLFSPPAPPQQLEGRRAALSDDEKRLVETFRVFEAARSADKDDPLPELQMNSIRAYGRFVDAAEHLARTLIERAEGGLNTKISHE